MEPDKKIELIIKIVAPLLTLVTVVVGVWQFNEGQKRLKEREIEQRNFELTKMNNQATIESLSKFKEMQNKLYIEATSVVSFLTVSEDFASPAYKAKVDRFWQLYWVELSAVETKGVETAMVIFGNALDSIQKDNSKVKRDELKSASLGLAKAVKQSASTWELPNTLQK